jgi:hypothetical protein
VPVKGFFSVCAAILLVALAWLPLAAQQKMFDAAGSEPRAIELVDAMQRALGSDAWDKVRYLRFDWVVERGGQRVAAFRHLWDRYDGRYRVEGKTQQGKNFLALFNVNTRAGSAWEDGQKLEGEALRKALEFAYARYINDTYWLVQPMKLKDPGVRLAYAGIRELNGRRHDVVHIWFDNVGLTPGDHYWIYLDPQSRRIARWAYFLESYKDRGAPRLDAATPWDWTGWTKIAGVWFATDKVRDDASLRIWFPAVRVLPAVEEKVFASPASPLPD